MRQEETPTKRTADYYHHHHLEQWWSPSSSAWPGKGNVITSQVHTGTTPLLTSSAVLSNDFVVVLCTAEKRK